MGVIKMGALSALVAAVVVCLGISACDDSPQAQPGDTDARERDAGDDASDITATDTTDDTILDIASDITDDGEAPDVSPTDVVSDTPTDTPSDGPSPDEGFDQGQPQPPCGTTTFRYDAGSEVVTTAVVAGTFNGWAPDVASGGWPLEDGDGDNVWTATHVLDPGEYQYKFVINGDWRQDPANPNTVPDGYGDFNSVLTIDCGSAALTVISYSSDGDTGAINATVQFNPSGGSLNPSGVSVTLDNDPVAPSNISVSGNNITVSLSGVARRGDVHGRRLGRTDPAQVLHQRVDELGRRAHVLRPDRPLSRR